MAVMIPDIPKEFDERSQEGRMFDELMLLSDEYYVFHSFNIVTVRASVIEESETDFVIFHPRKGIISIEAKAGQVNYIDGHWQYGSGIKMKHDGPYNQAKKNKWKLKDYMIEKGLSYELENCKLLHAVWFPDISIDKLKRIALPGDADLSITLTADSFGHIEENINRIFSIETKGGIKTTLSNKDADKILNRVLAPSFNLISLQEMRVERNRHVFKRMLKEQIALLNYLEDQKSAIINGLAGTGKTVMAVEKARRHSEADEDVLFLCYNSFLKEYLKDSYPYPRVNYYTIDGLACKLCETESVDYALLKEKLEEMYIIGSFPYKHVIIDEGQDFGKIEEEIIELLRANVTEKESGDGSFYLFYDKNQMVQSNKAPRYIEDADCKLTLYRNCRNTENIALTSLRLLGAGGNPKLSDDGIRGDLPIMAFSDNDATTIGCINREIESYRKEGYTDITILTCKTEDSSIMATLCHDGAYRFDRALYKFTTCRKFKGLESDAIILVDIDRDTFTELGEKLMYVGASRARYKLSCIINMSEEECKKYLIDNDKKVSRNILKSFATAFNAKARQGII